MQRASFAAISVAALCACSAAQHPAAPRYYRGGEAPISRAADSAMLEIPAGRYIAGSSIEERQQAYQDYFDTAHSNAARKYHWFDDEAPRHPATLPAFWIDQTPVTQAAYAEFVADTGAPPPSIDRSAWKAQRFVQNYDREVARFNWTSGHPPPGRADQPVVLITWAQAARYCAWRGELVGKPRRLPTAAEFEKAARGAHGLAYPWGEEFDASRLDSAVSGPDDTMAVGSFPSGASPYGMLDAAGNVYEWTSTPWPHGKNRMTVKGSAWDDYGGSGRGAARHGRRRWIHHVIVGFRCAG